uniref:Uncharacterized protein n=1 Tax=Heterorhabditis bacteriophora TaxID=37862 RepID=A0A1I7XT75_HETBA
MQLEVERKGYALTIPQPAAAHVVHGNVKYICWKDDLMLKGPVFISSSVRAASRDEITNFIDTYCTGRLSINHYYYYFMKCMVFRKFLCIIFIFIYGGVGYYDLFISGHSSPNGVIDYSPGSIMGRVFIEECLTKDEFQNEVRKEIILV